MRNFSGRLVVVALAQLAWATGAWAGVVAHYTFDESSGTVAHDSVGSNNGTLSGSAAFVAGGISGNAVSLNNATNDLVNMGDVLNPGAGDFSLEAWIKTTQTSFGGAVTKQVGGTGQGYGLFINNGGSYGTANKSFFYVSSAVNGPTSTITTNDGQWHQLIGVYQPGGSYSLYADGLLQQTKTSDVYQPSSLAFLVGGFISGGVPTNSFAGLVDDVQYYDNAVSASDAAFLFAHPGQVITVPEPAGFTMIAVAGLRLLWRRKVSPKFLTGQP